MYNKIDFFSLRFVSFLCSLLIPLLVSGPFLPDLIVSLLSIWFLVYCFKYKKFNIFKNKFFFIFILFYLFSIISSLLSSDVLFSLKSSFFLIRIAIFVVLISYLVQEENKIFNYFFYSFIITFCALIADGYFQYFTGVNFLGNNISNVYRVSSLFGDELILGSYILRLLPLFLAILSIKKIKKKSHQVALCALIILLYFLVFMSAERASFVMLNLVLIFLIISLEGYKKMKLTLTILLPLLLSIFLINNDKLVSRYSSIYKNISSQSERLYLFSPSHDFLIRTSWNMFLDRPFIGQGPKMFRKLCDKKKFKAKIYKEKDGKNYNIVCENHPHNFYAQILGETGLIGFIFLAGAFIFIMYHVSKHIFMKYLFKTNIFHNYYIFLFCGLLIITWPYTTNGNIFNNYFLIISCIQIGFLRKRIND